MAVDRDDDLFGGQASLRAGRVEDAGIGLVGNDPVDIGGTKPAASSTSTEARRAG